MTTETSNGPTSRRTPPHREGAYEDSVAVMARYQEPSVKQGVETGVHHMALSGDPAADYISALIESGVDLGLTMNTLAGKEGTVTDRSYDDIRELRITVRGPKGLWRAL